MQPAASTHVTPSGNLALIYQEVLTSIVRLRSGRQQVPDAAYFREQLKEALKLAHEEARTRGYSDEQIVDARFAIVAFLNESILNLRSPAFADWVGKRMQGDIFEVHNAGEVFYEKLDRLMGQMDSPALADVLEVYLLCLLLGYAGKYSASGRGELRSVRESVHARIRRLRGVSPELSPAWRLEGVAGANAERDPWVRRLFIAAVASFLLLIALFVVFKVTLNSGVSQVGSITGSSGAPQ